jgi:hypothetical protein
MASIGKVALSAISGEQQNSIGLLHGHFDFSLVKIEAPAEYHGLGLNLSTRRRHEAEEGHIHATARKLGALFAEVLPNIPSLQSAYGLRTSEIAADPQYNPRGTSIHGPLKEFIGADGTSIWAAATSGPGALQVHLLACMLARAFPADEATAIWVEIVKTRQSLLEERIQNEISLASTSFLARMDVIQDMLAVWDASARAVWPSKLSINSYQEHLTFANLLPW